MDLIRALGELAEAPGREQVRIARQLGLPEDPARAAYTDLFVVQLYPYASVYLSEDGRLGGQAQRRIADFWRSLGRPIPRDPDHIATLLATYARLASQDMRQAFLWEFLASWLLPFITRVRELGSPTYAAWGMLVLDELESEAMQVGALATLPNSLRDTPAGQAHATDAFANTLFAPARSGVILTRADLHRCARDLLLPVRVADRRYTLKSLLTQDARRVGDWLAGEAARQAEAVRHTPAPFQPIAVHWEQRAQATAARLKELAHGAVAAPTPPREN